MPVFVQKTPNPNALKFIVPEQKFEQPCNFPSAEAAAAHPLAAQLFALGPVYNVFMAQDFVTVNKLPDAPWEPLATDAKAIIARHFGESSI